MLLINFLYLLFCISHVRPDHECGRAKVGLGFNIGGDYSSPGQWPWLASLFYKGKYHCGSSVISKNHLLSAAHCFVEKGRSLGCSPSDYHAFIGRHDLDNENEVASVKKEISEIFVHPDWNSMKISYDADIAVLTLSSEITFNDFIQPICLPNSDFNVFNRHGTVAGYGMAESSQVHETRPRHVQIKSVEQAVCLFKEHSFIKISSLRMFCAGELAKNPCRGDSGGPFMIESNKQWTVIGIVSSAVHRNCHENDFVLFTQVPVYVVWIKKTMEIKDLECFFLWHNEYRRYECYSNFQTLEPNTKITSITGKVPSNQTFVDIETIVINSSKISYIPDFSIAITKFPNFKRLFLTNVGLKEIDKSKLSLLPQLETFNFYGNEIKELDENVFDDLKNLEILAFVKNQIKILPQKLLWNLPKLKEFWAWQNQIEAIPPRFFKNNKIIEKIWLQNNKIKKIGIVMRAMTNLKLIDLRSNACIDKEVEKDFDKFQNEIDEKCG